MFISSSRVNIYKTYYSGESYKTRSAICVCVSRSPLARDSSHNFEMYVLLWTATWQSTNTNKGKATKTSKIVSNHVKSIFWVGIENIWVGKYIQNSVYLLWREQKIVWMLEATFEEENNVGLLGSEACFQAFESENSDIYISLKLNRSIIWSLIGDMNKNQFFRDLVIQLCHMQLKSASLCLAFKVGV